ESRIEQPASRIHGLIHIAKEQTGEVKEKQIESWLKPIATSAESKAFWNYSFPLKLAVTDDYSTMLKAIHRVDSIYDRHHLYVEAARRYLDKREPNQA